MSFVLFEEKALNNSTEMVEATITCDAARVRRLLDEHYNPDAQDEDGCCALMAAARVGHVELLEMLLEGGASLNVRDQNGLTALMWACCGGHGAIVQRLLRDRRCDVNTRSRLGSSALILSAKEGHDHLVPVLLAAGADADAQDREGNTALMVAMALSATRTVDALLRANASPNCRMVASGSAAMHVAVGRLLLRDVQQLLRFGADPNARDARGRSPLLTALLPSRLDPLLERFHRAGLGKQALALGLHHAGHEQLAARLREPDVGERSWRRFCAAERTRILRALVDAGASVDLQDAEGGDNALMLACKSGNEEALRVIVEQAPDCGLRDNEGRTALLWTLEAGASALTRVLLSGGVGVNGVGANGETALTWALRHSDETMAAWILSLGGDLAATLGHDELVTPSMQCVVLQHMEEKLVALVKTWTPDDVAAWLMWSGVCSAEHRRRLTHARIDGAALLKLDGARLREDHRIVGAYREPILRGIDELRARMRSATLSAAHLDGKQAELVGVVMWGKYELVELLHADNSARVWRARNVLCEEADEVAIKFSAAFSRLQREADTLARLRSDFVVDVRELIEDEAGDAHALVMELGETSLQRLVHDPAARKFARRKTLRRMAECVAFLAAQGIVHGALRLEHVLVVGDRLKLVDFGLAVPDDGVEATAAADAFALGLCMVEVLTGVAPDPERFDEETDCVALPPAAALEPLDAKTRRLLPALQRLLARNPQSRPAVADLLTQAGALGGVESSPAAPPLSPRAANTMGPVTQRRPPGLAAVALMARRAAQSSSSSSSAAASSSSEEVAALRVLVQELREEVAVERANAARERQQMLALLQQR